MSVRLPDPGQPGERRRPLALTDGFQPRLLGGAQDRRLGVALGIEDRRLLAPFGDEDQRLLLAVSTGDRRLLEAAPR